MNPLLKLGEELTAKIEKLEAFEERLQVHLENLSVAVKDKELWFNVYGEIHSETNTLPNDISINCVLYDNKGMILGKEDCYIDSSKFFAFDVFEMHFNKDFVANEVNKIRIYPKAV